MAYFNIGRMLNESFEVKRRDSSCSVVHGSPFLRFRLTHCYVSRAICLFSRFLTFSLTLLLRLVILSPFFCYLLFSEAILFRLSLHPLADPRKYVPSRERRLAHLGLRILLFLPVWLLHTLLKNQKYYVPRSWDNPKSTKKRMVFEREGD